MVFATYQLTGDEKIPSTVNLGKRSTPVWLQQKWDTGEYREFIRKNGCGHCCTAMALRLNGVDIDPHQEFSLCRQLWGEPQKDREFPQDNLQSVAGITKIINRFGVKAEYFGVADLEDAEKHFDAALRGGKQIIFWSHPRSDFPENPFSKHEHYVMAVGYTEDGQVLVGNSSVNGTETGVHAVETATVIRALYVGSQPVDMTWGERDRYANCAGYVVVG